MTEQRASADSPPAVPPSGDDQGGDPVCWLNQVCPECGRFAADADLDTDRRCPECGAELP